MRKLPTYFAGLSLLLAAMISPIASAVIVEPGVEYPEGTKVDTPHEQGVSFTIPQGWSGILPEGGTFFVLGSQAQKAYIFLMVEPLTIAKAEEMMKKGMSLGNGLNLLPVDEIKQQGKTLSGHYTVDGAKAPMAGYIESRIGDSGMGVTMVAISAPKTAKDVQQVVNELVENVSLEKP